MTTPADRYLSADPRERDALLAEHVFKDWKLNDSGDFPMWEKVDGCSLFMQGTFTLSDLLDECKGRFPYFIVHYYAERRYPYEVGLGESADRVTVRASSDKSEEEALAIALLKAVEAEKAGERG